MAATPDRLTGGPASLYLPDTRTTTSPNVVNTSPAALLVSSTRTLHPPSRTWLAGGLAALVLLAAGCAAPEQVTAPPPPAPEHVEAPAAIERPVPYPVALPPDFAAAVGRGTRTTTGLPGEDYWTQHVDYTMNARLRPEDRRVEATAEIVYHNNSPDRLDVLRLELAQNLHREGAIRSELTEVTGGMALHRVAAEGQTLSEDRTEDAFYVVDGTQLIVRPSEPVPPGGTVALAVDWSFDVPRQGISGRMGYNRDDLFYIGYWYPAMSVYDDVEGWNIDQFTGRAEFYADFADFDVTVEVPAGWVVAATGALQNADEVLAPDVAAKMRHAHESATPTVVVAAEDMATATAEAPAGGLLRWRFTADEVRDFAFTAVRASTWMAARTPVGDRDGDGQTDFTRINTFYRPSAPLWEDVTAHQQHAITFLSEYTGLPYPWPHMTAVEGGGIIGGGMEFPMMTLMGSYNQRGSDALYNVTAHELAHMWIPMIVNTNERRYSWMDEGTTTFHENQARLDYHEGNAMPERADQVYYLSIAAQDLEGELMRRSDFHYPGPAFVVASYMKPATLLAALRSVLGEETFTRALRSFIETWAYKHPYPYDFFNAFERVSGRDLDWFWRSWYYETWTLDQAVADVETHGDVTRITIADRGEAPMPVDVVLTLAGGEKLRRELPVDVWLTGRREATLEVQTDRPVTRVEIDPEFDFPDVERQNNVWTREG